MRDPILTKALEVVPVAKLAESLSISSQAISQWKRVPVRRVIEVEGLTGIPRSELRPDIYPEPHP